MIKLIEQMTVLFFLQQCLPIIFSNKLKVLYKALISFFNSIKITNANDDLVIVEFLHIQKNKTLLTFSQLRES